MQSEFVNLGMASNIKKEKKNSLVKPTVLLLKIDLVLHPASEEGPQ